METKLDLPYSLSFHGTDITSLPQVYPWEWRVGPLESILVGGARKHCGEMWSFILEVDSEGITRKQKKL